MLRCCMCCIVPVVLLPILWKTYSALQYILLPWFSQVNSSNFMNFWKAGWTEKGNILRSFFFRKLVAIFPPDLFFLNMCDVWAGKANSRVPSAIRKNFAKFHKTFEKSGCYPVCPIFLFSVSHKAPHLLWYERAIAKPGIEIFTGFSSRAEPCEASEAIQADCRQTE